MIPNRVMRVYVNARAVGSLSSGKGKWSADPRDGCFFLSAARHMFNEPAMQARTLASKRLSKAIRASHGPSVNRQSQAKERVKRTEENQKDCPKEQLVGTRAHAKVKYRERESQVLKTGTQKRARIIRNRCKWDRFTPLTRRGFTRNEVLTNGKTAGDLVCGTATGVVLDGMKIVNEHMTHL